MVSLPQWRIDERERAAKLVEAERDAWNEEMNASEPSRVRFCCEVIDSLTRLAEQIRNGEDAP